VNGGSQDGNGVGRVHSSVDSGQQRTRSVDWAIHCPSDRSWEEKTMSTSAERRREEVYEDAFLKAPWESCTEEVTDDKMDMRRMRLRV